MKLKGKIAVGLERIQDQINAMERKKILLRVDGRGNS